MTVKIIWEGLSLVSINVQTYSGGDRGEGILHSVTSVFKFTPQKNLPGSVIIHL